MEKIGSLTELLDTYRTEEDCLRLLYELRTEDGWTCPECGESDHALMLSRRKIRCRKCSHQEAVTYGTAMYRTHLPLRSWLVAAYLVANDKRGVSARFLAHELQTKGETAYYLLQRIRAACADCAMGTVLEGPAELDDAYIGAGGKGLRGRGTDEAPFVVTVEKKSCGKLAMRAVQDCTGATYKEFAACHIDKDAAIRSDGWSGTRAGLKDWKGLVQKKFDKDDEDARLPTVHHVIGNFKNHVLGTYHGVTPQYLQSYMDEFCWRYNHRKAKRKLELLLRDLCSHAKRRKGQLIELFSIQPLPLEEAA